MRRNTIHGVVTRAVHSRRGFLTSASALGAAALGGTFAALLERTAVAGRQGTIINGYGPLRPVADEASGLELLWLPDGFRYRSFAWTGDAMADGLPTPGAHDGMAIIREAGGVITLCRNHEVDHLGRPFGPSRIHYDGKAGGGCTNLRFDANAGEWQEAVPSLSGTVKNCSGGPTPWGTWFSCEETVLGPGDVNDGYVHDYEHSHGWVFEVPAEGGATPSPLKALGRFVHEAIAVDPQTGYVYETEDRATSGFYRFIAHERGEMAAGGTLSMLQARGADDLRNGLSVGKEFDVSWLVIEDVERAHSPGQQDALGVYSQGKAAGGSTFARLEGAWYGNGLVYINSTSGGDAGLGQVWQYDPRNERLKLIFESPDVEVLSSPDNIATSPRGGLVLCEDGDYIPNRLHGMTPDGRLFLFAANNVVLDGQRNGITGDFRRSEWAGATFTADGEWLFVNIQNPGITFAITGPWDPRLL